MNSTTALAQLRHAYQLAIEGRIGDQASFARLLAPAIEALESAITERARLLDECLYAQWRLESCVSLQPGAQEVLDGVYDALEEIGEWPRDDYDERSRRHEQRCADYWRGEGEYDNGP